MQTHLDTPRYALVTGASSGIGQACATALLKAGWHVAFLARRTQVIDELLESLDFQASQAMVMRADIGKDQEVREAFDTLQKHWGRLDFMFNNAGVFPAGASPENIEAEDWRRAVDINLNGSFYCLSNAFRMMKSQDPMGGRILNNGSISAHAPRPGSMVYTTTKHAMTGLTKAAALDGRAFNIAVGQIDIGNVASDMTAVMATGIVQADGSIKQEARMDMDSVTQTVLNIAQLPLSANVLFTTIMATQMPFVGRG